MNGKRIPKEAKFFWLLSEYVSHSTVLFRISKTTDLWPFLPSIFPDGGLRFILIIYTYGGNLSHELGYTLYIYNLHYISENTTSVV